MKVPIQTSCFVFCFCLILLVTGCSKPPGATDHRDSALAGDSAKSDSARADSIANADANRDKPCFASYLGLSCN